MAKKPSPAQELSRRERQIMEIIYRFGEASVAQVRAAMPDAPSRNAVRTLLRILEEKGQLKHRARGRTYFYRPTQARRAAGRSAVGRVLHTFFGGSLEQALAVYLTDSRNDVTDEELARIEALVREARMKGK